MRKAVHVASPEYFVHESSYVDEGAIIGKGTKIWHFSHVLPGAQIGEGVSIGQNVNVSGKAKIGNRCKIQNNISIYDEVELEDEVFCGPSAVFTNVLNPRAFIVRKHEYRKTLVKRGATLGANSTIVCGTTIGRYAFIAAGAVVTRSVPDFALVTGVPARQAGWMCKCATKLKFAEAKARCEVCGGQYVLENGVVREV
jgi:UDP-2-acetamido-3-amino-2,3-dideoxy-glucuronate N-acetyltransferase